MYRSQTLALKYFSAAMTLFGVMTLFGLISAYYYLNPDFLFGILPFSIAKIIHINTLVIWLLMGFMASIYWFLTGPGDRWDMGGGDIVLRVLRGGGGGRGGVHLRAIRR